MCKAVAEEQATCLDGGPEEWRADATVEASESVGAEGLTKAIDGSRINGRVAVGLRLKADLDGVKGVFDELANDACCLVTQKG